MFLLYILTIALSFHWLGASGGGFLASARKSIRSSLKGGAVGEAGDFIERLPVAIVR